SLAGKDRASGLNPAGALRAALTPSRRVIVSRPGGRAKTRCDLASRCMEPEQVRRRPAGEGTGCRRCGGHGPAAVRATASIPVPFLTVDAEPQLTQRAWSPRSITSWGPACELEFGPLQPQQPSLTRPGSHRGGGHRTLHGNLTAGTQTVLWL